MPLGTAAILAIGSEMLGPSRLDTNSLKLTAALEDFGITVVRKSIVGDRLRDLIDEIRFSLGHADLLFVTGGLGPTEDDLTREALSEALGLSMEVDQQIIDRLQARFAARGWKMPEVNKRQANVFQGQTTLANERGTAPGFHIESEGKHIWVFPGVPMELEWMIATYLRPWLEAQIGGRARYRRVLKISGMTESKVEEELKPYYTAHRDEEPVTILASGGQIELHLAADGDETGARAVIAMRERELIDIFRDKVFGYDDDTLESVIGRLLTGRRETLAIAESCTGGLLAKMFLVGVDPQLIQDYGEVSEPVAIELAKGARRRFGATWGIGVTGVAGPGGGSEAKPVGTVHLAVAGPKGVEHRKLFWPMPRPMFKWFASQSALDLLRLFILRS